MRKPGIANVGAGQIELDDVREPGDVREPRVCDVRVVQRQLFERGQRAQMRHARVIEMRAVRGSAREAAVIAASAARPPPSTSVWLRSRLCRSGQRLQVCERGIGQRRRAEIQLLQRAQSRESATTPRSLTSVSRRLSSSSCGSSFSSANSRSVIDVDASPTATAWPSRIRTGRADR